MSEAERKAMIDALLEASPTELSGTGESAVARLVREDVEAGRLAAEILAGQAALGRALGQAVEDGRAPRARPRPWRQTLVLTGAVAAAAALVLLMPRNVSVPDPGGLAPGPGTPESGAPGSPATVAIADGAPQVEADGPFVVFPTRNPDITVIWLLPETEK